MYCLLFLLLHLIYLYFQNQHMKSHIKNCLSPIRTSLVQPNPTGLLASSAIFSVSDLPFKGILFRMRVGKQQTYFQMLDQIFTAIFCCLQVFAVSICSSAFVHGITHVQYELCLVILNAEYTEVILNAEYTEVILNA